MICCFFFFQAEDGIRDIGVTGVQTCALPILTSDPELRFTPSGAAVADFTIASTPRTLDRQTQEWKDGEALFLRCSCWRQMAEHVAGSLTRGSRVMAQGRLKQRSFETKEGEKRTVVELEVDEIGPSLRYATASVTKRSEEHTSE